MLCAVHCVPFEWTGVARQWIGVPRARQLHAARGSLEERTTVLSPEGCSLARLCCGHLSRSRPPRLPPLPRDMQQ